MKCEHVKLELEAYVRVELPADMRRAVKLHVENCPACAQELDSIHAGVELFSEQTTPVIMPPLVERRIRAAFASRFRNRRRILPVLAASLALLLICTVVIAQTPSLLDAPGLRWIRQILDPGAQYAFDQGLGQALNQEVTGQGITVTLHSLVSDPSRTLILFTITGNLEEGQYISGETRVSGSWSGGSLWQHDQGQVTGWIEVEGIDDLPPQLEISFHDLLVLKKETVSLDIDPDTELPQVFELTAGNQFTVLELARQGDQLLLKPDLSDWDVSFTLEAWQDGQPLTGEWDGGWTGGEGYRFSLLDIEAPVEYKLEYETVVRSLDAITFYVDLDPKAASRDVVNARLGQYLVLSPQLTLRFESLTQTISQTSIKYSVLPEEYSEYLPWFGFPEVYSGDTLVGFGANSRGEILIHPAVPLEDLEVRIKHFPDIRPGPVELSLRAADVGRTLDFDGIPMVLKAVNQLPGNQVEFILVSSQVWQFFDIQVGDAQVPGDWGISSDYEQHELTFKLQTKETEEWHLTVSAYTVLKVLEEPLTLKLRPR